MARRRPASENDRPTQLGPAEGEFLADRWRLERRRGRGGMGEVWEATDTLLEGRRVALKLLPDLLAGSARARKALAREASQALDLTHSNLARVHHFDIEGEQPFVVMELIEGPTLCQFLDEHDVLAPARVVEILRPLAEGLAYAHGKGLVHRDVKPSNILLREPGHEPVLIDFGIAAEARDQATRTGQTVTEGVQGTLSYMSPEQVRGRPPDPAMDVYSLAATAYEMLAGHPPFFRGDPATVRLQILNDDPAPIEGLAAEVWEGLLRGLAKDPEARARCPIELVDGLEGLGGPGAAGAGEAGPGAEPVAGRSVAPDPDSRPGSGPEATAPDPRPGSGSEASAPGPRPGTGPGAAATWRAGWVAAGALLGPVLVAASFFLVALVAAPLGSALASAWMASGSWGAAGSGSAQEALTFFVFQAVEWVFVPLALIWGSGLWLLRWAAAWMTRGPLAATLGDPSRRISLALGVGLGISAGVCWVVAPLLGSGGSVETLLPAAWVCLVGIGSLAAILRAPAWWGGVPRPAWSWALRAYAGASGASVQAALVLTWLNLARHQSLVDVEILQAATLLVPGTLAATLVALGLRRGAEERERRDLAWGAPWGLTGGLLIMAMFWTAKLQWKIEGQAAFVANLTLPLVAAGHAWWIRRLLLGRDPERAGPPR